MANPKILIEILNGKVTITSTEKNIDIWVADHDSPTDDLFSYQDCEPDEIVTLPEFKQKLNRIEAAHRFPVYPKELVKKAINNLKK